MRRLAAPAALLLLGAAIAAALWRLAQHPDAFRLACLGAALWTGALAFALRRTRLSGPAVAVAVTLAMLGAMDKAVALAMPGPGLVAEVSPGGRRAYLRDPDLGYAPVPGAVEDAVLRAGDRVIYRARYGIGPDGTRLVPGSATGPAQGSVVFTGCSVTFGDGLDDADTLPARFAAETGGRLRVANAGLSGYGTHQVLRGIETGRTGALMGEGPRLVVHAAIPQHLLRLAGLAAWDPQGPRYVLRDGVPLHLGPFHGAAGAAALRLARRSAIFSLLEDALGTGAAARAMADVTLWGAMLERAATLARERDGAAFLVLLWDGEALDGDPGRAAAARAMGEELARRGIPFARITELVPDVAARAGDYRFPLDGHPTPAMNARIAAALAARLGAAGPATDPSTLGTLAR